jgi:hypothetical protein
VFASVNGAVERRGEGFTSKQEWQGDGGGVWNEGWWLMMVSNDENEGRRRLDRRSSIIS